MSKIPEVPLETWQRLYSQAQRFAQWNPWERVGDSFFFRIQEPAVGLIRYGFILGPQGDGPALCVHRAPEPVPFDRRDCLMARFADREQLGEEDLRLLGGLGLSFNGPTAWPLFRSFAPGYLGWNLDEPEAAFLAFALRCARDWVGKVSSTAPSDDTHPGQVLVYVPAKGGPLAFEVAWRPQPEQLMQKVSPPDMTRLSKLPVHALRNVGIWEAEIVHVPGVFTERDRPYQLRRLLLVDQDSGQALPGKAVPPEMPVPQLLADGLADAIEEANHLPGEIILSDESDLPAMQAIVKRLGARVYVGPHRALPQAKAALQEKPPKQP